MNPAAPTQIQSKSERTLYNSSLTSIFFRNFFAGFSRSLGGLILYVIFVYIGYQLLVTRFLPLVQPYLQAFLDLSQVATHPPTLELQAPQFDTSQLQNLLKQTGH